MIVCHCKGISDRDIRAAVRSGANTIAAVGARCAAGTGCGGCHVVIDEILQAERAPQGRSGAGVFGRLAPSR
ncbi:MAG: (2Fe-2S)-binding protein [Deltaproteobacteria bacterium]|nr:(2Fe-2S)-binding protein [Deltaproteobacteria bacterium]